MREHVPSKGDRGGAVVVAEVRHVDLAGGLRDGNPGASEWRRLVAVSPRGRCPEHALTSCRDCGWVTPESLSAADNAATERCCKCEGGCSNPTDTDDLCPACTQDGCRPAPSGDATRLRALLDQPTGEPQRCAACERTDLPTRWSAEHDAHFCPDHYAQNVTGKPRTGGEQP